ncbi:hypothetical protein HHL26_04780 [Sphingobium sp. TB-6]|uniref:hypothetical protein n=1 Tax=Sphingobium sp. TB-6 TaxID=2728850 RepID=UPI00146F2CD6|nr:hypothetical protein [Sphingobium sp. TB-6]NML88380.1 hypothetical protein [Sphingobium sp. TB-6]
MIRRTFHKHDVLCAAEGCDVPVGRGHMFCKGHYFSLPQELRDQLWAAWRAAMAARRGTTTIAEQARINRECRQAFQNCRDYLRSAPTTSAAAMATVAIAASGEQVRFVNGRRL